MIIYALFCSGCRLPCDQVWCAYDVTVCVLYNHNVSFFYFEGDTNSNAEIHRFPIFLYLRDDPVRNSLGRTHSYKTGLQGEGNLGLINPLFILYLSLWDNWYLTDLNPTWCSEPSDCASLLIYTVRQNLGFKILAKLSPYFMNQDSFMRNELDCLYFFLFLRNKLYC